MGLGAAVVLALGACASGPRIDLLAPGDDVAMVKAGAGAGGEVRIKNDSVASDAGKGAGGGALAGAAWGLACGPFAIVCSPIGALAGAVVGGSAGAVVGSARGLTKEQRTAVNQGLRDYLTDQDLEQNLVDSLAQRVSSTLTVVPAPASNTVGLQMQSLAVAGKGSGRLNLNMRVRATVTTTDDAGRVLERHHDFEYVGRDSPVQAWIDNSGDFMARRFQDATHTLADNISVALRGER
jgi:hypothetical protein